MADDRGQARVQPLRGPPDGGRGVHRPAIGEVADRLVALGDGKHRAVVGQRGRAGDRAVGVRGGPQAVEPSLGHLAVVVEDDHVCRCRHLEQQVHVLGEADALRPAQEIHVSCLQLVLARDQVSLDVVIRSAVVHDEYRNALGRVHQRAVETAREEVGQTAGEHANGNAAPSEPQVLTVTRPVKSHSFCLFSGPGCT